MDLERQKKGYKNCRRIFNKTNKVKIELEEKNEKKKTLEPLMKAMGDWILPGLRKELEQFGSNESSIISTSSSSSSSTFTRKDYLNIHTEQQQQPHYNGNLRKRKRKYSSHMRIQDTSVPDKTNNREKTLIQPGDFPLAPHPRQQQRPVTIEMRLSPPATLKAQLPQKQNHQPTIPVIPVIPAYSCRSCAKPFLSRSGLSYHEEHAHSVCKFCSLWKKSKSTVCDRCRDMFNNQRTLKPKLDHNNKKVIRENNKVNNDIVFKCDFCPKNFGRKLHMIKHVMLQHSSLMHKVDLGKFVNGNNMTACLLQSTVEA